MRAFNWVGLKPLYFRRFSYSSSLHCYSTVHLFWFDSINVFDARTVQVLRLWGKSPKLLWSTWRLCVCVCVSPAKVECVSIRYCPIWELNQLTWCEKESEKLVTTIINAIKSHSNTHERLSAVSFIYVYIILNTYLHFIIASLVLLVSCYNTCEWCVKFDDFHHAYPIYAIYTSNKWCCWPRIWTWLAFHFTECVFV